MTGCPCSKFSWKKDCEVCTCTDKPTNGAIECDFDYEECKFYAQHKAEEKEKKQ